MIRCAKRFNTVVRHAFTHRLFQETIHGTDSGSKREMVLLPKARIAPGRPKAGGQGVSCHLKEGEGACLGLLGFWKQLGFKP